MKNILYSLSYLAMFSCNATGQETTKFTFDDSAIYGIDVSHYQKKIDWAKVAKNTNPPIQFVYIKSLEGVTEKDEKFEYNYRNAKANNLRVGAYHFFSPYTLGKEQFVALKKIYPKDEKDLPLMVDCEKMGDSSSKYFKELYIFLELCEKYYGSKPVIYSTQRFYNTHLKGELKGYQLMIGRYNNKKYEPDLLDGREWNIWQFSDTGRIDGISENVDLDVAKEKFWIH